jgi:single-strand DNA-binding protein
MSELKLEGKLHKIFETQEISSSFKKREFVIETEDKYPQMVKFELTQDKCEEISSHNVGDMLAVHFNIRGREWTSPQNEIRYFVSLNAWRIEKVNVGVGEVPPVNESTLITSDVEPPADKSADDLPF